VGFFTSNYSRYVVKYKVWLEKTLTEGFRAIHKEGAPHKYSLFWTTERSLGEGEGGNFFISEYGIRIQGLGAKNTMVACCKTGTIEYHHLPGHHSVFCSLNSDSIIRNNEHQQKKKVTPGHAPCSLCVRWSRRIEPKLASWVCGLLLGAWGQGSMPPGRTRRNQGLRRYRKQKGSPEAEWFSGHNPIG